MRRLLAAVVLVLLCAIANAGDALTESGTYVAHPEGGAPEQNFPVIVPPCEFGIPPWIIVGGTRYFLTFGANEEVYYTLTGDPSTGFEFDCISLTWTYFDGGFAIFGGTYTEPS